MKRIIFSTLLLVISLALPIQAEENINIYGQLPQFRSLAISPDGQHLSYIERGKENDIFIVRNMQTNEILFAGNITEFKARSTSFISNNFVLLRGSDTIMRLGYRGRFEHSGALAYNIETGKIKTLLKDTKDIHPAQTGLGRVIGANAKENIAYMPAYSNETSAKYNLYKVSLKTGKGKVVAKGNSSTLDWFVGEQGEILAREEYNESKKLHLIRSKLSGKWVTIYSNETPLMNISVQAVGADGKSLLFIENKDNHEALYSMSLLDGAISGPLFSKENNDIDNLVLDDNRRLTAVKYSGFKPLYSFIETKFNALFDRLQNNFPASSVHFESWTKDRKAIIIYVSGSDAPGSYYLVDTEEMNITELASQYDVPAIGEIKAVRYNARDGLKIPALITFPQNQKEQKNLPLIALPHGGPESYDQISFDWLAQYFSMKGYAVLQPNFRGSTGFGYSFRNAGRGRWGREMQDDVTDGVNTLIEAGIADPNRICILGASYGGYSALAGGAFSPDLYRCVIAINGVSDLPVMLRDKKSRYGKNHWVVNYWNEIIGNSKTELDKLEAISPANFAENFTAPILLIHGKDDTVVPIKQSDIMYKALKKAKKDVTIIRLKGEDHWLSTSTTRLKMLSEVSLFLDNHNPVDAESITKAP